MNDINGAKWSDAAKEEAKKDSQWVGAKMPRKSLSHDLVVEAYEAGFEKGFLKCLAMLEEAKVLKRRFNETGIAPS